MNMRSVSMAILLIIAGSAVATDITVCNSMNYGSKNQFGTATCVTRPVKTRPAQYLSPDGVLHYWSRQNETYCYTNPYGKERCIDKLDAKNLTCGEVEGVIYCQ